MGRYADPTEKAIRCPLKGHQRPLLACLACRHFPCRAMTEERLALLRTSPFVQLDTKNSKLLPRRHVMYIFRMTSGELRDAPEDFSPDAPDFEQLADVEEVLVIGKVLVKQLRLVAKPREERDRIREQLSTPDLPAADAAAASGTRTDAFGDCHPCGPFFIFPLLFSFWGCRSVFSITGIRQPSPPFVRLSSPALACLSPVGDLFCGVRHCQGHAPSRPLIPAFPVPDGLHVPLRTARARALPSAHPGAGFFP